MPPEHVGRQVARVAAQLDIPVGEMTGLVVDQLANAPLVTASSASVSSRPLERRSWAVEPTESVGHGQRVMELAFPSRLDQPLDPHLALEQRRQLLGAERRATSSQVQAGSLGR